jgi:hypothetical protein
MKFLRNTVLATSLTFLSFGASAAIVTTDFLDYISKPNPADYGDFPSPNLCEHAIIGTCDKYELIQIDYDSSLWGNDWNNVLSATLDVWLSKFDFELGAEIAVIESIELSAIGTYLWAEVDGFAPQAYGPVDVLNFLKTGNDDDVFTALLKAESNNFEYHQAILSVTYEDGINPPTGVPAPTTLLLMGLGLLGLGATRRRVAAA